MLPKRMDKRTDLEKMNDKLPLAGFALCAAQARANVMLRERLKPMLLDAVDAIEIAERHGNDRQLFYDVATKRIKMCLIVIDEYLNKENQIDEGK